MVINLQVIQAIGKAYRPGLANKIRIWSSKKPAKSKHQQTADMLAKLSEQNIDTLMKNSWPAGKKPEGELRYAYFLAKLYGQEKYIGSHNNAISMAIREMLTNYIGIELPTYHITGARLMPRSTSNLSTKSLALLEKIHRGEPIGMDTKRAMRL